MDQGGDNPIRLYQEIHDAINDFIPCDYYFLIQVMHLMTKELSDQIGRRNMVLGAQKTAKELKIVSILCKRLMDDNYFENARRGPFTSRNKGKHSMYMLKQDAKYLGAMFKYLPGWWD